MQIQINGNRPKEEVFKEIQYLLLQVQEDRMKVTKSGKYFSIQVVVECIEVHPLQFP